MKNKQLNIVLLILAVILIASINSFAQRGNRMAGANSCTLNIPGLTEKQKTEINSLKEQHRKEMDSFRTEWRQSAAYAAAEAHQAEVTKKVAAHREAVRNLLNDDQKSVLDNRQRKGRRNFAGTNSRGMGCGIMYRGNGFQGGRHCMRWGRVGNLN